MAVLDHNKLLVIHIPKNGCLCIPWIKLNGTTEENSSISVAREFQEKANGKFDSLLQLKSKLDISQYTPITITRNPYTRAYSLYNHYFILTKGGTTARPFSKFEFPFVDFLLKIKNNKPFHPKSRGLVNKTQSWFIYDESNQVDSSVTLYRLENLNPLKEDLGVDALIHSNKKRLDNQSEIDAIPVDSPKRYLVNFKLIYNITEYQSAYTQQCIDLVQEIYAEDFDNFEYSRNFIDSIT